MSLSSNGGTQGGLATDTGIFRHVSPTELPRHLKNNKDISRDV